MLVGLGQRRRQEVVLTATTRYVLSIPFNIVKFTYTVARMTRMPVRQQYLRSINCRILIIPDALRHIPSPSLPPIPLPSLPSRALPWRNCTSLSVRRRCAAPNTRCYTARPCDARRPSRTLQACAAARARARRPALLARRSSIRPPVPAAGTSEWR